MDGDADAGQCPPVSVIMTALEERRHLAEAVDSVFAQDYPGFLELVAAIGPSRDGTLAIARELAGRYPRLRVVENPSGRTPAGLNIAVAAADPTTTVIVRTDGHAQLPVHYIRTAVDTLQKTGAANVGGMMIPEGTSAFESAVARAMSRRIGMGTAPFHIGGAAGPAPTVYLGVFRRSALEAAGGFDEHFTRAQDWELNHRIRALGEVVWFEPRLRVGYRPRSDVAGLARQFRGSGLWRWQIIRAYPSTVSLRYLAAPLTLVAIGSAVVTIAVDVLALHSGAAALAALAVPAGYLCAVVVCSVVTRRGLGLRASLLYPVALVTMHMSWGTGFLQGACRDAGRALRARVRRRSPDAAARTSA